MRFLRRRVAIAIAARVALRPWALLNCLDGAHTRFTRRCDPLGDTITLSKFRAGD